MRHANLSRFVVKASFRFSERVPLVIHRDVFVLADGPDAAADEALCEILSGWPNATRITFPSIEPIHA